MTHATEKPEAIKVSSPEDAGLLEQRNAAWAELREIRQVIKANPEEATVDEVRRMAALLETFGKTERLWETMMMAAIGEDGPRSVTLAINHLKQQRDEFLAAAQLVLASFAYVPGCGPAWYEATRQAAEPKPMPNELVAIH